MKDKKSDIENIMEFVHLNLQVRVPLEIIIKIETF